jgi:hypothetical protein
MQYIKQASNHGFLDIFQAHSRALLTHYHIIILYNPSFES